MSEPTGEGRDIAVADGVLQNLEAKAVDLNEDHAREVGPGVAAPAGLPPSHVTVVEVIVVDGEEGGYHGIDDRDAQRESDAGPDALDIEAVDQPRGDDDHDPVEEQGSDPEGDLHQWKRDADVQRPEPFVDQAD